MLTFLYSYFYFPFYGNFTAFLGISERGCYRLKDKNHKLSFSQQLKDYIFENNLQISELGFEQQDLFWIAGIKKDAKGNFEVKFHDKTRLIELLLDYEEKHSENDGLKDIINAITSSAKENDNG